MFNFVLKFMPHVEKGFAVPKSFIEVRSGSFLTSHSLFEKQQRWRLYLNNKCQGLSNLSCDLFVCFRLMMPKCENQSKEDALQKTKSVRKSNVWLMDLTL